MKLQQISVFLENRPGSLTVPCRLLAEAGVSILTFSLADTQQFGILRLIVQDVTRACEVLESGGLVVKLTEVVAVEVPDQPGGLAGVLELMEPKSINVEYVYAFTLRQDNRGVLAFRFSDPDQAIVQLKQHGFRVVDREELERRLAL